MREETISGCVTSTVVYRGGRPLSVITQIQPLLLPLLLPLFHGFAFRLADVLEVQGLNINYPEGLKSVIAMFYSNESFDDRVS